MTNDVAERLEQARDLRGQIAELNGRDDSQEIIIRDTSPARKRVVLYSMLDGEAVTIPSYMAEKAIEKRLPDGSFMFTADKAKAPSYIRGQVKCFLHPDAPERVVLRAIGVGNTCPADSLSNNYSRRIHAQHRHKQEWAMYEEYRNEQRQELADTRQQEQIDAMMALANKAGGAEVATFSCDQCDFVAKSAFGLKAHQRSHGGG